MSADNFTVRIAGNKLYINSSVINLDHATEEEKKLIHQFVDLWKRVRNGDGIKGNCHSRRAQQRKIFDDKKLFRSQVQQLIDMNKQIIALICQEKFKLKEIGSS